LKDVHVFYRTLIAVCLFAAAGLANAEPLSGSKLLLRTLLTNENPNFVLMGAKTVQRDPATDQDTLDIVAELLVQRTNAHIATGADLDITSWLIKALGASKSARYRAVIDKAIAAYANEKVTVWGNKSLAELTKPSESVYSAGAISLEQVRKQLMDERAALGKGTGSIAAVKAGDSLDTVIAALGYPDELIETVESKGHLYVHIRTRSLQLQYYERGIVDLDNHFVAGTGWTASMVWPDVPHTAVPLTEANPGESALIMTSEPMVLQKLARRLLSRKVNETVVLDRVAERVQLSMGSHDENEVNALAYFCRVLGASGNKKYIETLRTVASKAVYGALRRHATNALEQLEAL